MLIIKLIIIVSPFSNWPNAENQAKKLYLLIIVAIFPQYLTTCRCLFSQYISPFLDA